MGDASPSTGRVLVESPDGPVARTEDPMERIYVEKCPDAFRVGELVTLQKYKPANVGPGLTWVREVRGVVTRVIKPHHAPLGPGATSWVLVEFEEA